MDLPDTHNLTSIIGQMDRWDKEGHLTQLLLSILSIGITISPECWLKFPIMVKAIFFPGWEIGWNLSIHFPLFN